jgi:hypothetical protein
MNTLQKFTRHLTRTALALAIAGLAFATHETLGQEKGGERLMKLARLETAADVQKVEAGDTVMMSCPKCKDTWVTVVRSTGKAVNPQGKKSLLRHECPGCQSQIVTEGTGKQAKQVVKHTCKHCGSTDAFCCVMKKGAPPTKGMEEHEGHQH